MTNPMLAELDEVVRLMEKATPVPWVANDGELATDLYWAGGGMVADALAEFADGLSDPPNAQFVAAAVNFLRTHHATLADMAKRLEAAERDAARYRWLVDNCQEAPDELGMAGQLYFGTYSGMEGVDWAIDEAMRAEKK